VCAQRTCVSAGRGADRGGDGSWTALRRTVVPGFKTVAAGRRFPAVRSTCPRNGRKGACREARRGRRIQQSGRVGALSQLPLARVVLAAPRAGAAAAILGARQHGGASDPVAGWPQQAREPRICSRSLPRDCRVADLSRVFAVTYGIPPKKCPVRAGRPLTAAAESLFSPLPEARGRPHRSTGCGGESRSKCPLACPKGRCPTRRGRPAL